MSHQYNEFSRIVFINGYVSFFDFFKWEYVVLNEDTCDRADIFNPTCPFLVQIRRGVAFQCTNFFGALTGRR